MGIYKSPFVTLLDAVNLISDALASRNLMHGFTVAQFKLRGALHDGELVAQADYGTGPVDWEPGNPVPGAIVEEDITTLGVRYVPMDVPRTMWHETEIDWRRSLVYQTTATGTEIYKAVKLKRAHIERLWPMAITDTADPCQDTAISNKPPANLKQKRRGPTPEQRNRVVTALREILHAGVTWDELINRKRLALAKECETSRDTLNRALDFLANE